MARFDSSIALAKRLITKNGQAVTLRGFSAAATPDPAKPWEPGANTPVDVTVDAVFLEYELKYIDGAVIQTGDQQVFIASTDTSGTLINPSIADEILRGSEKWKVVNIKPLNPNGQSIMFEAQVRR